MLEFIIGEAVWIVFDFLVVFILCYYIVKFPLKESIGFGSLATIVLTGLPHLWDYLPFHIAFGVFGITMFLSGTIYYRYLLKKSLKESIKKGLITGASILIIVLILAKLIDFLGI